jgi:hypothetical protein
MEDQRVFKHSLKKAIEHLHDTRYHLGIVNETAQKLGMGAEMSSIIMDIYCKLGNLNDPLYTLENLNSRLG